MCTASTKWSTVCTFYGHIAFIIILICATIQIARDAYGRAENARRDDSASEFPAYPWYFYVIIILAVHITLRLPPVEKVLNPLYLLNTHTTKFASMEPVIKPDERIVYKLYDGEVPKRNDVVIIMHPFWSQLYPTRVVELPGDTVETRGDEVFINGKRLGIDEQDHAPAGDSAANDSARSWHIPRDCYYLAGDYSLQKGVKNVIECANMSIIKGNAKYVYWAKKGNKINYQRLGVTIK